MNPSDIVSSFNLWSNQCVPCLHCANYSCLKHGNKTIPCISVQVLKTGSSISIAITYWSKGFNKKLACFYFL
jgi:hypothetical protein